MDKNDVDSQPSQNLYLSDNISLIREHSHGFLSGKSKKGTLEETGSAELSCCFSNRPEDDYFHAIDGSEAPKNTSSSKLHPLGSTEWRQCFTLEEYLELKSQYDQLEKRSQADISFFEKNREVCISGLCEQVEKGKTVVKELLNQRLSPSFVEAMNLEDGDEEDERHLLHAQSLSPGAESNPDSCYDSDSSLPGSRRNSNLQLHEDVTRQVSDTLASEHTESDDKEQLIKLPMSTNTDEANIVLSISTDSDSSESITAVDGYTNKAEFAIKLGYSEKQLQMALKKLGPDANQNDILNELINLSSTPGFGDDAEENCSGEGHVDRCAEDVVLPSSHAGGLPAEDHPKLLVTKDENNLRPIIIDGSNVAMSHGNKEVFSCRGIKLAVDWFMQRGHTEIKVFVPQWRKEASRPDTPITDQDILMELEAEKILVFTPARRIGGKRIVCYDDRYIVKYAADEDGIILSNDVYRDLLNEDPKYKEVIEKRLLMYSFVDDKFMPPFDPLGRHGPSLDNFLKKEPSEPESRPPSCPYGKKCTFGNKCKYYHPERGLQPHKSITDKLAEQAKVKLQEVKDRSAKSRDSSPGTHVKKKLTSTQSDGTVVMKRTVHKTKSVTHPQKQLLSRTKSLVPNAMKESASMGVPFTVRDSSPIKTKESGENVSFTKQPNTHLPKASDPEEWTRYDDRLSECRKRIEESEAKNVRDSQNWSSSTHSLKLPGWEAIKEPLRHFNSDPYSSMGYNGGHLALAKKLSDEGQMSEKAPQAPSSETAPKSHQRLRRQLSLKGPDDSRLQNRQQQQQQVHQQQVQQQHPQKQQHHVPGHPEVRFHGPPTPRALIHPSFSWSAFPPSALEAEPLPMELLAEKPPEYRTEDPALMHHQAVGRMSSAPMTYPGQHCLCEERVFMPKMTRQNSTSDSQLNIHKEDLAASAIHTGLFTESAPQSPRSPWYKEGPPLSPPFKSYSKNPADIKVHFGPPPNVKIMQDPHPSTQRPHSSRIDKDLGMQPHSLTIPNQSQMTVPPPSAPISSISHPSMVVGYGRPLPPSQTRSHTHPHNLNGIHSQSQVQLGMATPPSLREMAPSPPAYERQEVFSQLCKLFKEDIVHKVMLEYPHETNVQTLCGLIIKGQLPN